MWYLITSDIWYSTPVKGSFDSQRGCDPHTCVSQMGLKFDTQTLWDCVTKLQVCWSYNQVVNIAVYPLCVPWAVVVTGKESLENLVVSWRCNKDRLYGSKGTYASAVGCIPDSPQCLWAKSGAILNHLNPCLAGQRPGEGAGGRAEHGARFSGNKGVQNEAKARTASTAVRSWNNIISNPWFTQTSFLREQSPCAAHTPPLGPKQTTKEWNLELESHKFSASVLFTVGLQPA